MDIRECLSICFPNYPLPEGGWLMLVDHLERLREIPKVSVVKWIRPPSLSLKLNTYGCSKGNPGPSGGGGLLRNDLGMVLLAFSVDLGLCSSLEAEARALDRFVQVQCE